MVLLFNILFVIFFVTCLYIEVQFRKYIRSNYPEFWGSVNQEKMGVKARLSRPVAINQSIRFGALSKQQDEKIKQYVNYQQSAVIVILMGFVAYMLII